MSDLFDYGIVKASGNMYLGVLTIEKKVWMLQTCSPLSGQMSFKVHEYHTEVDKDDLERSLSFGVLGDGRIRQVHRTIPYQSLMEKCVEACQLLRLTMGKTTFLSVDGLYPALTDGRRCVRVEWSDARLVFQLPKEPERKSLRLIADPIRLTAGGKVLTLLTEALQRTKDGEDVFADPFAERNAGRKAASIIKQISPGLRQTARKISRK